jgi:hypothetical protein|tara:strand:+ start:1939 stop:2394 length:456 start_codon:yes stop_codon:yes gene_type:complete
MKWFKQVRADISQLVPAIDYYEVQLAEARLECGLRGSVEKHSRDMPGIVEYRFNQLQEIEGILEYLNIELRKKRTEHYRKFLEHYNRALSSRDAEKYVDGVDEVVDFQHIVNEFALVRNKFIGLIKALDAKSFQINNIVKLRAAGLEDVSL